MFRYKQKYLLINCFLNLLGISQQIKQFGVLRQSKPICIPVQSNEIQRAPTSACSNYHQIMQGWRIREYKEKRDEND